MAILLPTVGRPREVLPQQGPAFTLPELQAFVGGYIEALGLPDGGVLFINEHGKYLALPVNAEATALLRHRLLPDDVIVGPAVVCTRREAGEDELA